MFAFAALPCIAQPSEVSYQGELKKDGLPFTGTAQMKFVLIDGAGVSIWSNDGTSASGSEPAAHVDVTATNGIFAIRLGASPMEPISGSLLKGVTEVALRVWVNTGDGFEQMTDQPISSSAFSLSGEKCLEIGDLQINVVPRWDGSALTPGSLFDDGTNVGVGTMAPSTKLDVAGTVRSSTGGFQFPDGTLQTTAVTGGGGGVPSGSMLLTFSPGPPSGYSYTGLKLTHSDSISWISTTQLPMARVNYCTASVNGLAYMIGGQSPSVPGAYVAANYAFDPIANEWIEREPMPVARSYAGCAALDGYIYVVGGNNSIVLASNERYDPVADNWSTLAPMPAGRNDFWLTVANGKLLAIGGQLPYVGVTNSVEEYDPLSDSWTSKSPMPFARYAFSAATINEKVYVFGGIDYNGQYQNTVFEYDSTADSWTQRATMTSARAATVACTAGNKIYLAGGGIWLQPQGGTHPVNAFEEYDPLTDTWSALPPIPFEGWYLGIAHAGGSLFVFSSIYSSNPIAAARFIPPVYFYAHSKE